MTGTNGNDPREDELPPPANPEERSTPLPWEQKKHPEDDSLAESRVERILSHPSYKRADQDPDFLNLAETRGARLELDYLKPELLLKSQNIEHTIVVFGSTRICEPAQAQREYDAARREAEKHPDDRARAGRMRIAEKILAKSRYYDMAREFGTIVGRSGQGPADSRIVLMTGGGPGIMEGANRGAFEVGAKTTGLNITLPHEQYPNPYVTPELCFSVHYFAVRKLHFLLRAKALVVFPGGYGTLDELFETLTLIQTRKIKPLPVVLVGKTWWQSLFDPDFLVDEGVIELEDCSLFWYAETAQEIWDGILAWHRAAGEPLD